MTLINMKNKKIYIIATLIAFVLINIGVVLGSVNYSIVEVYSTLFENTTDSNLGTIILKVRLPRTLLAFTVGFALSMSGTIMQQVLRNPLASTYTIGVSSGASLGVAVAMIFGIGISGSIIGKSTMAFGFGIATFFIVMILAKAVDRKLTDNTIILVGFVISIFINALVMSIAYFDKENYQQIMNYQLGSFAYSGVNEAIIVFILIIICIIIIYVNRYEIDILNLGEVESVTLGVNITKTKILAITIGTLLCGVAVAFAGIIAFIDLIAPHIARKYVGNQIMPSSILAGLIGGSLMVASDIIARVIISPMEVPIGVVTALIGTPFFLVVYIMNKKQV